MMESELEDLVRALTFFVQGFGAEKRERLEGETTDSLPTEIASGSIAGVPDGNGWSAPPDGPGRPEPFMD